MKEDFWGNRNILAKIQPSELFAETYAIAAHQVLGVSVMTDEGATVLFFHMGEFLTPTAEPDKLSGQMLRNLLQVITQKNLQLNAKLTHLTQRTTREKLLSYLVGRVLVPRTFRVRHPLQPPAAGRLPVRQPQRHVPRAVPAPGRGTYPVPAESLRPPAPTGHSLRPAVKPTPNAAFSWWLSCLISHSRRMASDLVAQVS